jgi:hypothetical protein
MNRLLLIVLAALTGAWIVGSLFLLHGWTINSLLRNIATWVDIPLAAWLCGMGWMVYRRRRRSSPD